MSAIPLSKNLHEIAHRVLKPLGLTKRSATWFIEAGDLTGSINLQRSMWSAEYYVNVNVFITGKPWPRFSARAERLVQVAGFHRSLRFADGTEVPDEAQEIVLRNLMSEIVPVLKRLLEPARLRSFLRENPNIGMVSEDFVDALRALSG